MSNSKVSNSNKINLRTTIIVSMNCMMGAGIFALPVTVAMTVGPAGILSMLLVIISVWFIAYSLAQVAAMIPKEGSFYSYASHWGGHGVGLLAAWSYEFGLLIAMALLCWKAAQVASPYVGIDPSLLKFLFLGAFCVLNMLGVVVSKTIQYAIISLTIFALLMTTIVCFGHADINNLLPFAPQGTYSIFSAMSVLIFGLFGFESAASLYPVVEDAQKNVPKALAYSIAIVGSIYLLFIAAIMLAVPNSYFVNADMPITEALARVLGAGSWVLPIISFAMVIAILGVVHSMIWSSSALMFSLFERKKSSVFKSLIKRRVITPNSCVVLVGLAILSSFPLLRNIDLVLAIVSMAILLSYVLSMFALFKGKKQSSLNSFLCVMGIMAATGIFFVAVNLFINAL